MCAHAIERNRQRTTALFPLAATGLARTHVLRHLETLPILTCFVHTFDHLLPHHGESGSHCLVVDGSHGLLMLMGRGLLVVGVVLRLMGTMRRR